MKFAFVLLIFSLISSGLVKTEYYAATYDNVDVDAILNNELLLKQYLNCIFDNGPCTADGRNFRRILPEAMTTRCEKCTPMQKQIAKKISIHLKEHKPEVWAIFREKFDPNGTHITAFEKFLVQVEE